ncbi:hypothetical protein HK097_002337 [Rhizophlyctis rosea]|uniref:MPN domain-containing protein n=1 Tax=Rhizophlyctis rosea TaxID=64517 RepID=A0AAD5X522_9FUNG|nr:hypothetical protein HK097_002337 [Rhizophlyctis rosea]
MAPTYTLQQLPYLKLILHAAKYPLQPVAGILIGIKTDGPSVTITDALPLFHSHPLSPNIEIALQQADTYSSQTSQQIVGVYSANEIASDKNVAPAIGKLAAKVDEILVGGSVLLQVDPTKVSSSDDVALIPHTLNANTKSWKPFPSAELKTVPDASSLHTVVEAHLQSRTYESLHDFDNHLDNIQSDWLRNPQIQKLIKA